MKHYAEYIHQIADTGLLYAPNSLFVCRCFGNNGEGWAWRKGMHVDWHSRVGIDKKSVSMERRGLLKAPVKYDHE